MKTYFFSWGKPFFRMLKAPRWLLNDSVKDHFFWLFRSLEIWQAVYAVFKWLFCIVALSLSLLFSSIMRAAPLSKARTLVLISFQPHLHRQQESETEISGAEPGQLWWDFSVAGNLIKLVDWALSLTGRRWNRIAFVNVWASLFSDLTLLERICQKLQALKSNVLRTGWFKSHVKWRGLLLCNWSKFLWH